MTQSSLPDDPTLIELVEERLAVGKVEVETARVRLSIHVDERAEHVRETLRRDGVNVERVPVNRVVEFEPVVRQDGQATIYPIVEEILVKRWLVIEELHITRTSTLDPVERDVTLRVMRAEVERTPVYPRAEETHMPRTLTAMYENRSAADIARTRLIEAGLRSSEIDIQDQGTYDDQAGASHQGGVMASLKNLFGSHDDHHAYAEGLNRGHVLLSATVDDGAVDPAIDILESTDAIDLDRSQSAWRESGWAGAPSATTASAVATGDDVIELAEERLVVGKREVERGGLRVRSYIVSTPVSEQVSLREETVGIERRPVDRAIASGEDAFRDRVIELRETGEEVVVGKEAFVTEEIVLRKDVGQRTEEVSDTVRHTEVEIERVGAGVMTGTPDARRV